PPAIVMCSTPFGIIGILTCHTQDTTERTHVLNAFRHHLNSYPYNPPRCTANSSAQRLSASSEFSHILHHDKRRVEMCSTAFCIIVILTARHSLHRPPLL